MVKLFFSFLTRIRKLREAKGLAAPAASRVRLIFNAGNRVTAGILLRAFACHKGSSMVVGMCSRGSTLPRLFITRWCSCSWRQKARFPKCCRKAGYRANLFVDFDFWRLRRVTYE